jgi:hypothetical protein
MRSARLGGYFDFVVFVRLFWSFHRALFISDAPHRLGASGTYPVVSLNWIQGLTSLFRLS